MDVICDIYHSTLYLWNEYISIFVACPVFDVWIKTKVLFDLSRSTLLERIGIQVNCDRHEIEFEVR